jgi:hypothetical protein
MDVSGGILAAPDAGHPCRQTKLCVFMFGSECKIMTHFVVKSAFLF